MWRGPRGEAPPDALTGAVTPTPPHYVRSNFSVPAHDVTLTMGGAVGNEMTLTLDDLRALTARHLPGQGEVTGPAQPRGPAANGRERRGRNRLSGWRESVGVDFCNVPRLPPG